MQTDHHCISSVSLGNQDERSLCNITQIVSQFTKNQALTVTLKVTVLQKLAIAFPSVSRQ